MEAINLVDTEKNCFDFGDKSKSKVQQDFSQHHLFDADFEINTYLMLVWKTADGLTETFMEESKPVVTGGKEFWYWCIFSQNNLPIIIGEV